MAKGKNTEKAAPNPKKRRLLLIAEILCIVVVLVCAFLIYQQVSKYWVANEEFDSITEEYQRDIDLLETDNPNCVGWVYVPDTRIDYPVMYTPNDPEYYLRRNFEGAYSISGTPFLGKGCLLDGNSSIIYGHHMNDGSMFTTLDDFANPEFGLTHDVYYKSIVNAGVYKLLACWNEDLTAPNPYRYWDQVGELTEEQFNDYVANAKKRAIYETGVTAEYGDELLALSTCSYGTADERFIVLTVKVDTIYKDEAPEE